MTLKRLVLIGLGLLVTGCLADGGGGGGLSSPEVRIRVLIATGRYKEAEALITSAAAAGLLLATTEEAMRRQLADHRRQHEEGGPGPRRDPVSGAPADTTTEHPSSCMASLPDTPLCWELPEEYTYTSAQHALRELKLKTGQKNLSLHAPSPALSGPCPDQGTHFNIRWSGDRGGSITCCPCCVDTAKGPLQLEKCRIVP